MSWLFLLIPATLLTIVLIPFAGLIFGALKFVLWVEPRQLKGNGVLARLPRPKQLPRFGLTMHFLANGAERVVHLASKDGSGQRFDPLVSLGGDLSGQAAVFVFDADGVRDVLNKTDVFVKHPPTYDVLAPLLGNGLVLSVGDLWRRQRKLITPMFHFQRLRAYTSLENEEAARLVELLVSRRGAETAPVPLIATCMQLIVMRAVFGERFDIEQMSQLWGEVNECFLEFILAVTLLPRFFAELVPGRVHRTFACLKQVRAIIGDAVDRARAEKQDADCDDMVGQMAQLDIDRELIVDECITFMFAGRDTVSHTMGYAIYFLVQHPEIQEQLLAEAETVGLIDDDAVGALKLHAAVIRETLRLRPPLPTLNRVVAAEEGVELLGQFLPKDTEVVVSALGVQRASAYWGDDSLQFRPSRWFEESQKTRHPFAWVPFSASTRSCIGMKLAQNSTSVILAHIVRHFRIEGDVSDVVGHFDGTYGPGKLNRIRFIER